MLVVLGGSTWTERAAGSALFERAAGLAGLTGAEVLVLKVCNDDSLSYGPFASREEIDNARSRIVEDTYGRLSALTEELSDRNSVSARGIVKWHEDPCKATLDAVSSERVDLVMKEQGDHDFRVGLFSNADWDLLRQSPVPVWFVAPGVGRSPKAGIVAAVDHVDVGDDEERFQLDHQVFEQADALSRLYESPFYVVHAYSVPRGLYGGGYSPMLPAMYGLPSTAPAPVPEEQDWRQSIAKRHGDAIQAFVAEYGVPLDDLTIVESPVDAALLETAESKKAGLIVMGATRKNWWARLLHRVSAELTLSDAECDILFAKLGETTGKHEA
jgi:nucleotide-binding universal stress UspA family protein